MTAQDAEPRFAQCRNCRCMCIDTPAGLLNPQKQRLGTYTAAGRLLTLDGVTKGHFLHRCPEPKL